MRHAAPVRRELAARTVFNVLGPLTNPAGARAQVVGVYAPAIARTIADALVRLDARRAYVVHGAGGHRRALARRARTSSARSRAAQVREYELDPEDARHPALRPGRAARRRPGDERAGAARRPRRRRPGGHRSAVLLNAAGAIAAGGHAADLREGLALAREAIDSGAAEERLDELIAFSERAVPS